MAKMVRLTHISKEAGQIVCDLKGDKTLRLDKKQSIEIAEEDVSTQVEKLIKKGHLACVEIGQTQTTKSSKKDVADNKEKGEK